MAPIAFINIRTVLEQYPHRFNIPLGRRQMQRSREAQVACVDIRPTLNQ
jgi:hypothetical protein